MIAFLGGTIGNFRPGPPALVPGPDRDPDVPGRPLPARHRPGQGPAGARGRLQRLRRVTAEFNKNVLHVLNRELDADFDPDLFEHVAFFDADNEWIDIRLRSLAEQFIDLRELDMRSHFARNEEMRTEISTKFTRERPRGELRGRRARAGRVVDRPGQLYALSLAKPSDIRSCHRTGGWGRPVFPFR